MAFKIKYPFAVQDIIDAVRCWVDLLIKEDYQSAYNFTIHDNYHEWTPELIQEFIKGYGFFYEEGNQIFKVTDWRSAVLTDYSKNSEEVELFDSPIVDINHTRFGYVHYDLPLNGKWSDVTAIFDICKIEDDIVLMLKDIHVL